MGKSSSKEEVVEEEHAHALTWNQPERTGKGPSARNGHTTVLIGSRLFVFGGGDKADLLNELWVLDAHTGQWSQPPTTGESPPARSRHTCALADKRLFVWGGIGGGVDMWVLEPESMVWSCVDALGDVPSSRFGHTCTVIDPLASPRLFVLGGHNSKEALSDVHVYDIETSSWHRPQVDGEPPVCGNRHATVLLEDAGAPENAALLVFAADMHDTFGTLYALRIRDASRAAGVGAMGWLELHTSGKAPLSRARPSVVALRNEVFVICGVAAGKPLNSVAMLNTDTMRWSSPIIEGVPPPPRMGATATLVGTDVYLFGG